VWSAWPLSAAPHAQQRCATVDAAVVRPGSTLRGQHAGKPAASRVAAAARRQPRPLALDMCVCLWSMFSKFELGRETLLSPLSEHASPAVDNSGLGAMPNQLQRICESRRCLARCCKHKLCHCHKQEFEQDSGAAPTSAHHEVRMYVLRLLCLMSLSEGCCNAACCSCWPNSSGSKPCIANAALGCAR
jgi:hypothetical protein